MSLQDFFNNVRIGQRLLGPPRATSGTLGLSDTDAARLVERADLWLTPRTVAGYDPEDFLFLEPDERRQLDQAVKGFREIAEQVPPIKPATEAQARDARRLLEDILRTLDLRRYRSPQELIAAKALDQFKASRFAPDYLENVLYRFDEDGDGEMNLAIWLVLRDDVVASSEFFEKARELRLKLGEWLESFGVASWPLIGFRSASEQGQLEVVPVP